MVQDSALTLKRAYEKGDNVSIKEAKEMLNQSELVRQTFNRLEAEA